MRYIRFLKSPRVVGEKNSTKLYLSCLITITSDLGDSFLAHKLALSAELIDAQTNEVIVWKTVQWHGGRTLPIALPLSKSRNARSLRVRVGVEPKSAYDDFCKLLDEGARGVVSVWSAPLDTSRPNSEARKLVERRFKVGNGELVGIWEETGESIARHLWDAGITLSCHINQLLSDGPLSLLPSQDPNSKALRVIELGTGCGMVGITIAHLRKDSKVTLTDLAEAREIVERNLIHSQRGNVTFAELDWEEDIDESTRSKETEIDLVIAADCTYNPDSSPALVTTIHRLVKTSPRTTVVISMKLRHSSETIFFDLMRQSGFHTTNEITYLLPGDEYVGEETVYLYTFCYRRETDRNILSS